MSGVGPMRSSPSHPKFSQPTRLRPGVAAWMALGNMVGISGGRSVHSKELSLGGRPPFVKPAIAETSSPDTRRRSVWSPSQAILTASQILTVTRAKKGNVGNISWRLHLNKRNSLMWTNGLAFCQKWIAAFYCRWGSSVPSVGITPVSSVDAASAARARARQGSTGTTGRIRRQSPSSPTSLK